MIGPNKYKEEKKYVISEKLFMGRCDCRQSM